MATGQNLDSDIGQAVQKFNQDYQQRSANEGLFDALRQNPNFQPNPADLASFNSWTPQKQSAYLGQTVANFHDQYQEQQRQDQHNLVTVQMKNLMDEMNARNRDRSLANQPLLGADGKTVIGTHDENGRPFMFPVVKPPFSPTDALGVDTGVPGIKYIPGAHVIVRDPNFTGTAKVINQQTNALSRQAAQFGLGLDDLNAIDADTPDVVKYMVGGQPVTADSAALSPSVVTAVGDAAGTPFKIPLPKFQSLINQRNALNRITAQQPAAGDPTGAGPALPGAPGSVPIGADSAAPAASPAASSPASGPTSPAPATDTQTQAAAIKAQFQSGAITRDQAKAQLQTLGFQ